MYRVEGESSGFRDALGESLTIGSNVVYLIAGHRKFGKIVNENGSNWIAEDQTNARIVLSDFSVATHQVIKL